MLEFELPNDPSAKWGVTITGNRYVIGGYDTNAEWIPAAGSGQDLAFGLYIGKAGLDPTFLFAGQGTYARTTVTIRSGGNFVAVGEVQRAPKAGTSQSLYVLYDDVNASVGGPGFSVGVYTVAVEPRSPVISARVVGSRMYFA